MARRLSDYSEADAKVRPPKRGSRPRTKQRPAHEDAITGRVLAVDRGRFDVLVDGVRVRAMKARELGRKGIVVGDEVALVGDASGDPDTLARIVRREPRRTLLRRTADDTDPVERGIVANVERMLIVTAVTDPEPRPRLIDRCLVAAWDAGIEPALVVTKADLADPSPLLAQYAALDLPAVVVARSGEDPHDGLDAVRELVADRWSVLVGHSGVGKSTLVNALVPGAGRSTGVVNDTTGRGRHTSTSAVALELPGGGWTVDTPGIRSFGLAHVGVEELIGFFPDLAPGTEDCPRTCPHLGVDDCALDDWVSSGRAGAGGEQRLDSLRRLIAARAGE
ncbi:ribosome biogenesis GTPase [Kytococcus aerolatus]|uniref:Small ribosomal subunit biogenesis GTPase RsgA n=1 Tax=Kytococcus aerolatus TaxID=592308 RepID=A0A212T7B6_9MICO|nr:ribosome small subunit-dependent GTPase A [Kytococcus aerolatus]SNC61885.1 ribosome biogenesis GTPase [Kytococcus aerolatus]